MGLGLGSVVRVRARVSSQWEGSGLGLGLPAVTSECPATNLVAEVIEMSQPSASGDWGGQAANVGVSRHVSR